MTFHKRKMIRLPDYDYSLPGYYFVTICTQKRQCVLGNVGAGSPGPIMELNPIGKMVDKIWKEIPDHYPGVEIDEFVVMPNHLHGIIVIGGAEFPGPIMKGGETPPLQPTLGHIVAYFKYQSTKQINMIRHTPGIAFWQRNYYERVIRHDKELEEIRHYIHYNPCTWEDDEEYTNPP